MSAAGIRAGKAYVELGANDSKLIAGLRRAQAKLRAFGTFVGGLGAAISAGGTAIATPLAIMTASAAASGDELSKMADRTGASVEALSELKHAAEQSDVSFEQLGGGIKIMQKNLAAGDEAFAELGLNVESLLALEPDKQFEVIAERISSIQNPAARTAAAMAVFGKSGADLLPLMIGGAKGIQELRNEAKALGLQVSTKDAQAATLFGDTWANLMKVLRDVRIEIGNALIPILTGVAQAIIPIARDVAKWVSDNRNLVVTVLAIAVGLIAFGSALVAVGAGVHVLAFALGGLVILVQAGAAVFAAITSPIGLVIGLVLALAGAIIYFSGNTDAVLTWLGDGFKWLYETAAEYLGAIGAALQRGDISAAANIMWLGLKAAWLSGTHALSSIWLDFKHGMVSIWFSVEKAFRKGFADLTALADAFLNRLQQAGEWLGSNLAEMQSRGSAVTEGRTKILEIMKKRDSGEITKEEAAAQLAAAEKEMNDKLKYARESGEAERNQINDDAAARAAEIDQSNRNQHAALDAEYAALQDANASQYGDAQQALNDELAAAKAAYKQSVADERGKAPEGKKRSGRPGDEGFDVEEYLNNILNGIGSVKGGGAAFGTFSAAQATQNYGAGNLQQQMANSLKTIAGNTDPKNQRQLQVN